VTQRDLSADWELGDLLTPEGNLTRAAPIYLRRFPPIEDVTVRNGFLMWQFREPDRVIEGTAIFNTPIPSPRARLDLGTRVRNEKDMLRRFVELCDSSDQAVLEFAKCWGRLRLCEHSMPHDHGPLTMYKLRVPQPVARRIIKSRRTRLPRDIVRPACFSLTGESLHAWRFFSRQAQAILKIAARVHSGRVGANEDWEWVLDGGLPGHPGSATAQLNHVFLVEALRGWTSLGRLRLWVPDLEGKIKLTGFDLFAKLAIELVLAVSRRKGFGVCSACGRQYEPSRRPARDRSNYCDDVRCQREAARRRKAASRNFLKRRAKTRTTPDL